jgi:hypothetical protein
MKQKLLHILDSSVCITTRQLKEYVAGTMSGEECHAVEHHLNSCPFCSDALDGAFSHSAAETLAVAADFNGDFLKAHFSLNDPQLHLNSMLPSVNTSRNKRSNAPFWLKISMAAAVIISAVILIVLQIDKGSSTFSIRHSSLSKATTTVSNIKPAAATAKEGSVPLAAK